MKEGVLLPAHGAPERLEDVPQHLAVAHGGQQASPGLIGRGRGGGGPERFSRRDRGPAEFSEVRPAPFRPRSRHA